jgi:hypothetical protein
MSNKQTDERDKQRGHCDVLQGEFALPSNNERRIKNVTVHIMYRISDRS